MLRFIGVIGFALFLTAGAKSQPVCVTIYQPPLTPPYPKATKPPARFREIRLEKENSPEQPIVSGAAPVGAHICNFQRSNASDVRIRLADGREEHILQPAGCHEYYVASSWIKPGCWAGSCSTPHFTSHCKDGRPLPDELVWTWGWVVNSIKPSSDQTFLHGGTIADPGSKPAKKDTFFVSEIRTKVDVCVPQGTTIFYDESDPFGSSPKTIVAGTPCTAIDAKAIWIESEAPVNGTFQAYFE